METVGALRRFFACAHKGGAKRPNVRRSKDMPCAIRKSRCSNLSLPIFSASLTEATVNHAVRPFLRLLALVWLTLGMSIPVSAWTVHNAAHGAAQVSVDEHHHHEVDGGISVHEHDDDEAPDGGHDHMPSILLGAVTVPQAGVTLSEPLIVRQTYTVSESRVAKQHPSDGLRRPPRLG